MSAMVQRCGAELEKQTLCVFYSALLTMPISMMRFDPMHTHWISIGSTFPKTIDIPKKGRRRYSKDEFTQTNACAEALCGMRTVNTLPYIT